MKTKPSAIVLVIICTFLASFAQVLYKMGADSLIPNFLAIITNLYLIGGITLYLIGAVLLILALKGGELSVLYPVIALNYIWVSILSQLFFGEEMNLFKWAGVAVIMLGVSFIGFGNNGGKK